MVITGKRIRTLKGRLGTIKRGDTLIFGARLVPSMMPELARIGFPSNANVNDVVLPAMIGPVTGFNAEGGVIVHKDRKMETAYRTIEWSWEQWNGPYYTETQTDFRDIPYKRYPRTKIPPPSVELQIAVTADGQRVLVAPKLKYSGVGDKSCLHVVNLLLEILGFCEVFTADLAEVIQAPLRRLNWKLLPSGKRPWREVKKDVDKVITSAKKGNQPVIEHRMETLNGYGPDFVAVGQAGFAGYVVFGFTKQQVFVFESIYTGNATYLFGSQWEPLSKLTKTEVLDNKLHLARVLHRVTWADAMRKELKKRDITVPVKAKQP